MLLIDETGKYFSVKTLNSYVIKTPKHKKFIDNPELVKFIVDVQNELSKLIEGVFPCRLTCDGKIKMPRAKGMRLDEYKTVKFKTKNRKLLNDFEEKIKTQIQNDLEVMKDCGYFLEDFRDVNLFYEEEKDLLQYIDFSGVKRIEVGKR